jgi:hypothetical protein
VDKLIFFSKGFSGPLLSRVLVYLPERKTAGFLKGGAVRAEKARERL